MSGRNGVDNYILKYLMGDKVNDRDASSSPPMDPRESIDNECESPTEWKTDKAFSDYVRQHSRHRNSLAPVKPHKKAPKQSTFTVPALGEKRTKFVPVRNSLTCYNLDKKSFHWNDEVHDLICKGHAIIVSEAVAFLEYHIPPLVQEGTEIVKYTNSV